MSSPARSPRLPTECPWNPGNSTSRATWNRFLPQLRASGPHPIFRAMSAAKRVSLGLAIALALGVAAFALYVSSRQHLRFDVPEPPVVASLDSAVIARGHHIVRDVGVCGSCHAAPRPN